jgi:tetratricopeptide (TPR) repeat protein
MDETRIETDTLSRSRLLIQTATKLEQSGEHTGALPLVLQALQLSPNDASAYLLLGVVYRELGMLDEARTSIEKALTLDPKNPDALQTLGLVLLAQGRLQEGEDALQRHLSLDPSNLLTLRQLTEAMLKSGRADEAVSLFENTCQSVDTAEMCVAFGRFLVRARKLDRATRVLTEAAHKYGNSASFIALASVLVKQKQYSDAVEWLNKALAADPKSSQSMRGLADCYVRLDRMDEAISAANQAVSTAKQDPANWFVRGSVLYRDRKYEAALADARQGLTLVHPGKKGDIPLFKMLSRLEFEALAAQGQYDEALTGIAQVRTAMAPDEELAVAQVSLLVSLQRYEEALRILDASDRGMAGEDSSLVPLRYSVLHALGRGIEARQYIEPVLTNDRADRVAALGKFGVLLYTQGRVDASRQVFLDLVYFTPDLPSALSNLAFILIGDRDLRRAETHLLHALDLVVAPELRALVLSNLAYLRLIDGHVPQAAETLDSVISLLSATSSPAILRVAYWRGGIVSEDYLRYPRRFMSMASVSDANMCCVRLAQGDASAAEVLARRVQDAAPNTPVAHLVWASVQAARGETTQRQDAEKAALDCVTTSEERDALATWLGRSSS